MNSSKLKLSEIKSQKRLLRQQIFEMTYPEGWSNNPESVEKVQRLSKELEELGEKEKQFREVVEEEFSDGNALLVEVIYNGDVLFCATKKQITEKCKISIGHLNKLIKEGKEDKYKRSYRIKEN